MELAVARWLVSDAAPAALAAAEAEPDPTSVGAAERLRRLVEPAQAAAVAEQAALRRRAVAKFGPAAARLFFTPDGLEQATRRVVAARRAAAFVARGVRHVIDLGCGIGADALALRAAGLAVTAVERDPVTAVLASANLGQDVLVADAEQAWAELAASDPEAGVFADPARRTAAGRSWRVEDLSPPWTFIERLLDGSRPACVKLGPGVPHALVPDAADAAWVSDRGSVVEATLWAGAGSVPGRRRAQVGEHEVWRDAVLAPPPVGELADYLYEPDGAVIRAGLVPAVADAVGACRVHDDVAYLTGPTLVATPFATAFAVDDVLGWHEKTLRAWVRESRIGTLEIKKRGLDVDPAALRKRLRPSGPHAATLILTPTASGTVAVVARRVG